MRSTWSPTSKSFSASPPLFTPLFSLACKLIHDLHPEMSLFYRLSEAVSGLDLLCSLARIVVSAAPGHCFGKSRISMGRPKTSPPLVVKPVFGDTLAIQEGRHMIIDRFGDCLPVSNNTVSWTFIQFLFLCSCFSTHSLLLCSSLQRRRMYWSSLAQVWWVPYLLKAF